MVGKRGSSAIGSKTTRSRKKKSLAWDHFDDLKDANGNLIGKCKGCEKEYAADSNHNGTTNMLNHIPICPNNPNKVDANQTRLSFQPNREVGGDKGMSIVCWKFSQDATRKALTKMIIIDELPFKFVENDGFKQFMAVACPNFKMSSRRTLVSDIFNLYASEFELLKRTFKNSCQRVCLTTDTWTSIQRINYMCVTAHVVDDNWNLHKRIINFCPIAGHKGVNIGSAIEKCVRLWEMEDKVFTITVDNASSNDSAMSFFKKKMSNWNNSILKGEYLHIRCVSHILNLVVNDGLKLMNESIERVRFSVRYSRQSPSRLNKFKEYAEVEKIESKKSLCLDVPTRWNSTYLMLDVAQQYERSFDRYDEQEPCFRADMFIAKMVDKLNENNQIVLGLDGKVVKERTIVDMRPTSEDWTSRKFAKLLEHFYNLTLKISGSLYITSNRIVHDLYDINELLVEWRASDDLDTKNLGMKMKEKFDKYWGDPVKMNSLIYVALVFDPRYKLDYTKYLLKKMYGDLKGDSVGKKLTGALRALYNDYKCKKEPQVEGNSQGQSSSDVVSIDESCQQKENRKKSLMDEFKKLKALEGCIGDTSSSELDKYLREENEPDTSTFDILIWWKHNALRFPILSSIVRDVLAIPMSTVVSESSFSTCGLVLDSFRSSMTPKIVEALICSQDWIRLSRTIINLDDTIEDLEKFENEFSKLALDSSQASPMEI